MMHVLHYHKNPKLQLSGLKQQKKGRVIGALSSGAGFADSMLYVVIFSDACKSLLKLQLYRLKDMKK